MDLNKKSGEDGGQNGTEKSLRQRAKVQAVKLGREIGFSKAAEELGINVDMLYGWSKATKEGGLDPRTGYPHSGKRNEPHRGGAEAQTAKPQPGERKRQTERRKRVSRRGKHFFAASRRKFPKV